MLADKKVRTIVHLLLVHHIDGAFGLLSSFEGDVAFVEKSVTGLSSFLNISRNNFSKLSEHSGKFVIVSAGRQALHKQVVEGAVLSLTLLSPLVSQHFNRLSIKLDLAGLFDRGGCRVFALKLNVAEASALSVGVKLKLARTDRPKFDELVIELLLGDGEVNVTHQHVRLGLNEFAFLQIAADVLASNLRVVKLAGASASLIFIEELKEAVAILALGLLVHSDEGLIDVVSHLPHVLV